MERQRTMEYQKAIGFNAFDWKIVALAFMVLDHVCSYLNVFPEWVSLLPRFVAPLFVYFLVEGFHYTHSRKAYALRLYIMAAIMFAGNMLINFIFHNVDYMTGEFTLFSLIEGHNILFTLAIFFTIMCLMSRFKQGTVMQKVLIVAGIAAFSMLSLSSEGGIYLLPVLFICYFGYGKKKIIVSGILILSALFFVQAIISYMTGASGTGLYETLCFDNEWMMALVVIPILFYNGKRGNNSAFAKWMFYIIYPLHLWILMILRFVLA